MQEGQGKQHGRHSTEGIARRAWHLERTVLPEQISRAPDQAIIYDGSYVQR